MVIETVQFSFPIDFLESLTHRTNSNVRYFTASGTGKGGTVSSRDETTDFQIIFDRQKRIASLNISGDFSHKEKSVRFNFEEWSESEYSVKDENVISKNIGETSETCTIRSRTRRPQKRDLVRAIIDEESLSPKSKIKKTTNKSQLSLNPNEKQTLPCQNIISTDDTKKQVSLNLRPRVSDRKWSALEEEDVEKDEDLFECNLENEGIPNFYGLRKILPKPGNLKPGVNPLLAKAPVQSCSRKKMSSNRTKEKEISTITDSSIIPLMESTEIMKIVAGEKHCDGKRSPYCLVSSAEGDKKVEPVYFYTNISKGVETDPGNVPEEFEIVPVPDAATIPIVINIRKYESHRKHCRSSLTKKLETIRAGLNCTTKEDNSHMISNRNNTLSMKLKSLQNTMTKASNPNKIDSRTKTGSLKGSLRLDGADQSQSSSSDSEKDYEDEMDLIRIPELSVLFPSTFIHKKSYVNLKVGKEIDLLKFTVSSTDLLRCSKVNYYIQGTKEGVEGTVLLGPFALSDNPHVHLSFIPQPQILRRIPEAIYKRRRDRWLRKHEHGDSHPRLSSAFVPMNLHKPWKTLQGFTSNHRPPFASKLIQSETKRRHYVRKQLDKSNRKQFVRSLSGEEGDCSVAFVDHDYLREDSETVPGDESTSNQRETTRNEQLETEDLMITSTWGIQNEAGEGQNEAAVEQQVPIVDMEIPLISSLAEAMTTELKTPCLTRSDTAPDISPENPVGDPEEVTFESLPPVTVEATLNSAGVQLNCRVLRLQKPEKIQPEQAPAKPHQAPADSDEAPVQSVQTLAGCDEAPVQSAQARQQGLNVRVANDDSLHTQYRYTCKYCLKLTVTNFALYDHIRFTHQDVPGYLEYARDVQRKEGIRCEYCQKDTIFYSQDGLRTHTNFHHPEKVKGRSNKVDKRTCPTCKRVFSQIKTLRKHIERIHVGVQFLCHKCPGIFKSEEALENHMKGKHDNIRNYACDICGASYVTRTYLRKHVKQVHKKDKEKKGKNTSLFGKPDEGLSRTNEVKKCILCGHKFDQANLKKHMRQIHGVDFQKLKRCSDCSLTFNTRAELEYHRHTTHNVGYKLSCPYCGASYVLKNTFYEHILSFHFSLNVHQCYICKQSHNKAHKLLEHMLQDHPGVKAEDEDHQLSCSHCPEKFPTHNSLVDHVLSSVHHGVFPNNCLTCPQRFMHEHDLENHIKVVHGMNEDVDFEIRCNSVEDKMVQMVVQCEVKGINDLPAKAQLALKRLYSQGKTVMIVSKRPPKKESATEKKNNETTESQTSKNKASTTDSNKSMLHRTESIAHLKSQEQNIGCTKNNSGVTSTTDLAHTPDNQTSNPQVAVSQTIIPEASSVTPPQYELHDRHSQQSNEVLRVYRLAVQSEEVARAFQTLNPNQGRQLQGEVIEEQVLSVDDEFVVAEQIGRLDESGNIIEDRVVYVDYEPVPQEMLLNMLPQNYMQ